MFFFILQASAHNKNLDVGANIFIGNLDPEIDEKLLYDTFSAFGVILQTPKVCWKHSSCQFMIVEDKKLTVQTKIKTLVFVGEMDFALIS